MINTYSGATCFGAAAAFLAIFGLPAGANANPAVVLGLSKAQPSAVVKTHDDADDDADEDDNHRRWYRPHRHVDAPFTHVETGRRVIVEAPFASVYVGRHGRHVRAPFVDLWVPR